MPRVCCVCIREVTGAAPVSFFVMVCDRCRKSTLGKGYVIHERHRDDPEDYRHVLCHECSPAYEKEENQWQEAHAIPFSEGVTSISFHWNRNIFLTARGARL